MRLESIILNFENKTVIISICENVKILMTIQKKISIHRIVRAAIQMMISAEQIMTMSVKLKNFKFFKNRDYSFFSKKNKQLSSKKKIFAHVIDIEIKIVQIKNTSNNFEMNHFRNYSKKNAF